MSGAETRSWTMISILANVVAGSKCKHGEAVVLHSHACVKHHLRENEMQVLI